MKKRLRASCRVHDVIDAGKLLNTKWRKRMGVEPINDGIARRPPVLKTGTITGPHALPALFSVSYDIVLVAVNFSLAIPDTCERTPRGIARRTAEFGGIKSDRRVSDPSSGVRT